MNPLPGRFSKLSEGSLKDDPHSAEATSEKTSILKSPRLTSAFDKNHDVPCISLRFIV